MYCQVACLAVSQDQFVLLKCLTNCFCVGNIELKLANIY